MPLEPINQMMQKAQRGNYAVGYFESWSLESLLGVIDAAESTRSPVILGFNGEFLCRRPGASVREVAIYSTLGCAAAAQAGVPCGLIFNECSKDAWVECAIESGFNLVMPADPDAGLDEYTSRVKGLALLAHKRGIAIEAEIDELPCNGEQGVASVPNVAASFVAATGVDLLAVSVGNEHIKLKGRSPLDLRRLEAVHQRIDIPLVLHGGSGIEDASLRDAIGLGVRKVNYGTYIKQRYLSGIRIALNSDQPSPHALLGDGGATDVIVIGRSIVRDAVLERIELLGCCGKA
jgi:fructose/tagatose bisphosphate aldolase